MDDAALRGQLRINSTTLDSDLRLIRNRFAHVSEPRPVKTYGTGEIRFWMVQPSSLTFLAQRGIVPPITLSEGLHAGAEPRSVVSGAGAERCSSALGLS